MTDSKKNKTKVEAKTKTKSKKVSVATKSNVKSGSSNKAPKIAKPPKKQSLNKIVKTQNINVPDLNKTTGYPVHPNRIWPD